MKAGAQSHICVTSRSVTILLADAKTIPAAAPIPALARRRQIFRKILIANRGEIAVRILRACRELGVRAALVYSDADRASLDAHLADEAYRIGPAPSRGSYLSVVNVLRAAAAAGCEA